MGKDQHFSFSSIHSPGEKDKILQYITEYSDDLIYMMDTNQRFTFFSSSIKKLLGYTPEEAVGLHAKDILTEDTYNYQLEIFQQHIKNNDGSQEPTIRRGKLIHKNGGIIWGEAHARILYDENGQPNGAFGILRDITEKIKTEKKLQESKKQLNLITENSEDMIYATDMNQQFTYFSPSVEKLLGYTPEEALELEAKDIMTKESYSYQLNMLKHDLEHLDDISEASAIIEVEMVRKDGSHFWGQTYARIMVNEANQPEGVFGICRDITLQKQREAELEENKEKYQLIAEHASDMIYVVDLTKEQKFKYVSPSIQKILGYTPKEAYSLSAKDIATKESYDYQNALLTKNLEEATDYSNLKQSLELELVRKDGKSIWGEAHAKILTDKEGKPTEIIGIIRDITQRKNDELELKRKQDNLKWLNKSATQFLTMKTEDEVYDFIGNQLALKIEDAIIIVTKINSKNDTLLVKNFYGIENKTLNRVTELLGLNPAGKEYKFVEDLKKIYTKQKIYNYQGDLKAFSYGYFSGSIISLIQNWLNINDIYTIGLRKEERLFAAIHIFKKNDPQLKDQDILETFFNQASIALERKILENEVVKSKEKAEESDRLKTAFLSNISHEVRTPLNLMVGYLQMLENEQLPKEEKQGYLNIMKNASEQLLNIINDILSMSRLETGQLKVNKEKTDINDLMNHLYSFFETQISEKNLNFSLKTGLKNNRAIVMTDQSKLNQVLINLLNNAFKFTDSGTIQFGYYRSGNFLEFFVSDTGIGIEKAQQRNIFKSFLQADTNYNRKYEGTGLGLSISKALVELLGGEIWVKSNRDKGTCFYFTIPYN